jgi:hypothetical protein
MWGSRASSGYGGSLSVIAPRTTAVRRPAAWARQRARRGPGRASGDGGGGASSARARAAAWIEIRVDAICRGAAERSSPTLARRVPESAQQRRRRALRPWPRNVAPLWPIESPKASDRYRDPHESIPRARVHAARWWWGRGCDRSRHHPRGERPPLTDAPWGATRPSSGPSGWRAPSRRRGGGDLRCSGGRGMPCNDGLGDATQRWFRVVQATQLNNRQVRGGRRGRSCSALHDGYVPARRTRPSTNAHGRTHARQARPAGWASWGGLGTCLRSARPRHDEGGCRLKPCTWPAACLALAELPRRYLPWATGRRARPAACLTWRRCLQLRFGLHT